MDRKLPRKRVHKCVLLPQKQIISGGGNANLMAQLWKGCRCVKFDEQADTRAQG